jgi:hypothetical protein
MLKGGGMSAMSDESTINERPQASRSVSPAQARQTALLAQWAARYVWWKSVPDALRYPGRIIAQVMNIGDYEDLQALIECFGVDALREVIRHAEAGQFNARSWAYWHYRLGLIPLDAQARIPPLPARNVS